MMNEFEQLWGSTEAAVNDKKEFDLIDEGTYFCKITKTEFDMTKDPAKVILTLTIDSAEGETNTKFKGRKLWANYQMNPQGVSFFKRDLTRLGVDHSSIKSLDELATNLGLIEGKMVEAYVKNKPSAKDPSKMFTNTFINGVIDTELGF